MRLRSAELRRDYRVRLERCVFLAIVAHIALFSLWRKVEVGEYRPPRREVIIQVEEVPETRREVRRPPPPPRPSVPIVEAEGERVSEDVTIGETELDLQEVPPPPPAPPPEPAEVVPSGEEEEIVEFWHVEVKPQLIEMVVPEYPEIARRAGIEGTVFVKILVGKDGRPEEVKFLKGPEIFREVALDAARRFLFSPAKQNDRPVKVWVVVPIQFRLEG
ncbi:MAG: energy transducer TonB [Candidatus Latescibacterota bacterium]|nr:MAG: energy transducer TonB [Candidatus Latescibacterota bacterium]RKY70773.1 MAG: energy transducer TonB [Candidatus Latescibacterota bacterium]HDH99776.1 energy transducer TonB [Bacillota bacterium]